MKNLQLKQLINFFGESGILKKVKRTGWTWRNVPDCESIADHCYRVNLIAMFLCDAINSKAEDDRKKFNVEKVMRMATLHEIAEARIGDIPYPARKYIGDGVKKEAEKRAFHDMTKDISRASGIDYEGLWEEFENGSSMEGRLVRSADKVEMLLQALEYEKAGVKTLSDFWENEETFEQIGFIPVLKELVDGLIEMREKLMKNGDGIII